MGDTQETNQDYQNFLEYCERFEKSFEEHLNKLKEHRDADDDKNDNLLFSTFITAFYSIGAKKLLILCVMQDKTPEEVGEMFHALADKYVADFQEYEIKKNAREEKQDTRTKRKK